MEISQAHDPVASLRAALPDVLHSVTEYAGETTLEIDAKNVVEVVRYLRDTQGLLYNFLSDISAVDYYPDYSQRPGRFGVAYHLYSMIYNRRIRVKIYLDEDAPEVDTMTTLWPVADFLEREIFDLMGINFRGHPNMRRLLLSDDWSGHPLRRDYPLGYETVQFSFNAEQIMKHKPFAKD